METEAGADTYDSSRLELLHKPRYGSQILKWTKIKALGNVRFFQEYFSLDCRLVIHGAETKERNLAESLYILIVQV